MKLFESSPWAVDRMKSQNLARRKGDENNCLEAKEALQAIGKILTDAGIIWWVDCGTCLGAYRYGGVIPWDEDVDIALLEPDFRTVSALLNDQLDPKKFAVVDLSARDHPNTLLKVYTREKNLDVDVYFFKVDPVSKMLSFILSQENHFFLSQDWVERELPFKTPVAFDTVFPLQKATFDGIEVFVPNNTEKYLQRVYGENLAPAKIYNPIADCYEKDLTHPYWDRPFAH